MALFWQVIAHRVHQFRLVTLDGKESVSVAMAELPIGSIHEKHLGLQNFYAR